MRVLQWIRATPQSTHMRCDARQLCALGGAGWRWEWRNTSAAAASRCCVPCLHRVTQAACRVAAPLNVVRPLNAAPPARLELGLQAGKKCALRSVDVLRAHGQPCVA